MPRIGVLTTCRDGSLQFLCPGCGLHHRVRVEADPAKPGLPVWGWNGDYEKPTFTPSIGVHWNGWDTTNQVEIPKICHSFVTDGKMQFLPDCTHEHAGQTLDIVAIDDSGVR